MNLIEIPNRRDYFGGGAAGDSRAINRHSVREYEIVGSNDVLVIDRCTNVIPRYFSIYYKPAKGFCGVVKNLAPKLVAKGDGLSWNKFIELLKEL